MNEVLTDQALPSHDHSPYFLDTCSQLFNKVKFLVSPTCKNSFLLQGLCSFDSLPSAWNVLPLDSHMTAVFSLLRDQPKYYSPGGLLWILCLSFSPITLSQCPVLLTSKHMLLSEITFLIGLCGLFIFCLLVKVRHFLVSLTVLFTVSGMLYTVIQEWSSEGIQKHVTQQAFLGVLHLHLSSFSQSFSAWAQLMILYP